MASNSLQSLWKRKSRYRIILPGGLLSIVLLLYPLQHHFSLGRYQHYALSFGVLSAASLLQSAASWNQLSNWSRISHIGTGAFLAVVACVFWTNPWLDWRVAVQTEDKEHLRAQLLFDYFCASTILALCWVKSWVEENRRNRKNAAIAQENNTIGNTMGNST